MDPTPVNLGELGWRLGLALATVNFIIIAVVVSAVNPRAGRSGGLVFALFAFIVYYNFINITQSWVTTGRATFAGVMLVLHGGVFVLSMLWLTKQHNNWSLLRLGRKAGARA
jgi:lipopolysaccharide export system permease protein